MALLNLTYPGGPVTVAENTPGNVQFGQAYFLTGGLLGLNLSTVRLTGPDAAKFTPHLTAGLLGDTLTFTSNVALDYEAKASYSVGFAVDSITVAGTPVVTYTSDPIAITVADANDNAPVSPHFISGGAVETGTAGAVVGVLGASDPDTVGGPMTFSIVGGTDAGLFEIGVDGVTISLKAGAALDIGSKSAYAVTVQAFDGANRSEATTLGVVVTNASHPGSAPAATLQPGQSIAGYSYSAPGIVSTSNASYTARAVDVFRNIGGQVTNDDGSVVHLDAVNAIKFADGSIDYNRDGPGYLTARLYETLMGREADPLGLSAGVTALARGVTLTGVADAFLGSAEFAGKFGNQDDQSYVRYLYEHALGRAPDAGGEATHLAELQNGVSRAQLATIFAQSDEAGIRFVSGHPNGVFTVDPNALLVEELYKAAFGRLPDTGGLNAFTAAVTSGALDGRSIADEFSGSAEFVAKHGGQDNSGFVQSLYQDALGRAADTGGLNAYTTALNAGVLTRSDLVLAFATSPESQGQFAASMASYLPPTNLA